MNFQELMQARTTWHPRPPGETTPELAYRDRIQVQMQIQRNFAMAFSIFSMVVLAVPLGLSSNCFDFLAGEVSALPSGSIGLDSKPPFPISWSYFDLAFI